MRFSDLSTQTCCPAFSMLVGDSHLGCPSSSMLGLFVWIIHSCSPTFYLCFVWDRDTCRPGWLELLIFLTLPLKCRDYRYVPPYLALFFFLNIFYLFFFFLQGYTFTNILWSWEWLAHAYNPSMWGAEAGELKSPWVTVTKQRKKSSFHLELGEEPKVDRCLFCCLPQESYVYSFEIYFLFLFFSAGDRIQGLHTC